MGKTLLQNAIYQLREFYGGTARGRCLQITPVAGNAFMSYTRKEARALARELSQWTEHASWAEEGRDDGDIP